MALAATGDPGFVRSGMVRTGVRTSHLGLSPDCLDPREVAKYAIAVSNGLTEGGVAPSAKHFPGHGDTHVDSHLALPVIKKSEGELHETELVPFRALIESGIATIMTGHMALPLVVGEDDKETPCSCSRTVTTELLRDRLGFKGVIVTDCLEMDAVAAKYTTQKGAVLSLEAGADVVMICHTMGLQTGAIEEAYEAVEQGTLSLAALRESGALKGRFAGTWDSVFTELDERRLGELLEANKGLSERAYGASTAVIKGPLPEVGPGPVLVLTPERAEAGPHYMSLAGSVRARRQGSVHVVYSRRAGPGEEVLAAETAVVVLASCGVRVCGELRGHGGGARGAGCGGTCAGRYKVRSRGGTASLRYRIGVVAVARFFLIARPVSPSLPRNEAPEVLCPRQAKARKGHLPRAGRGPPRHRGGRSVPSPLASRPDLSCRTPSPHTTAPSRPLRPPSSPVSPPAPSPGHPPTTPGRSSSQPWATTPSASRVPAHISSSSSPRPSPPAPPLSAPSPPQPARPRSRPPSPSPPAPPPRSASPQTPSPHKPSSAISEATTASSRKNLPPYQAVSPPWECSGPWNPIRISPRHNIPLQIHPTTFTLTTSPFG